MFGISGKWFNTKTKRAVIAEDTYQEDGRMYVKCVGMAPIPMEEFQNNYIQMGDGESVDKTMPANIPELDDSYFDEETAAEADSLLNRPVKSVSDNVRKNSIEINDIHKEIIRKAFDKQDYKYTFNVKATSAYPKKIHNFLKEFTDVTDAEIIEYIIETYINQNEIRAALEKEIRRQFGMKDVEIETSVETPVHHIGWDETES